ncbi:hypothetical protein F7725_014186 [Dissostichus mawsoni]|uniref:Uncharacterized protein n=1 Tax=Dissostichus mawsoni TaxID=36200 RepID=A0A7J5YZK5_DISMA|nr:hypothetical protein F7725_014186 [Dissostichus mawsoni]
MIRVVPHQPSAIIIPLARAEEQPERSATARRSLASRRLGASLRPPDVKGDRSPSVSGFPPPCLTLRPCALIPPRMGFMARPLLPSPSSSVGREDTAGRAVTADVRAKHVDVPDSSDGGGQPAGQQFGGLSEVFWFGPQQGDDVLQAAGRLQAQSVHHVAQICTDICGQLFSGMGAQLGDEQDGVTVGLHGCPGDGAQPVICSVVQLGKIVT